MKCDCGNEAEWVSNAEIYGRPYGKSHMIWLCRECDAYVGCHNNTKTPKGTLAKKDLREARQRAHSIIDPLWQYKLYTRKDVYLKLKESLGKDIHVGETKTVKECEEIITTAKRIFSVW